MTDTADYDALLGKIARRLYVNQSSQGERLGLEGPWWDDARDVLAILANEGVIPPGEGAR